MMKKLTALLLALTMVLSLVTVASAEGGTIAEVTLSHAELTVGQPLPELTAPADANYTVNSWWQDLASEPTPTVVEAGHRYRLQIEIRPVAGYKFSDGIKLYLNGDESAIGYRSWNLLHYQCDVTIGGLDTPVVTATTKAATGQPYLKWDAVEGAVAYEIWRSVGGSAFTRYYTTTYDFFNNISAQPGTTYSYKVRAVDAGGAAGEFSSVQSVLCVCAAPNVRISTDDAGKPYLRWDKVQGAVKFEIWRSVESGPFSYYYTTDGEYYAFTNSSAESGRSYAYKVRTIGQEPALNSPFSPIVNTVCRMDRPELTMSYHPQTGRPRLTWEPVEGAVRYEIQRSVDGMNYAYYYMTDSSVTVFNNISAKVGETYHYRVRALSRDGSANSNWSYSGRAVCRCATPTLWWNRAANGAIVLNWSEVEGAVRYEVYRSFNGGNYRIESMTEDTTFVENIYGIGHKIDFKVRAVGEEENTTGAFSNVSNTTTRRAPEIRGDYNDQGKPQVYWSVIMGAYDYVVYRAVGDGEFSYYYTTAESFFTNISAEPGVTYRYKVRARTADRNTGDFIYSPYTEEVSITSN